LKQHNLSFFISDIHLTPQKPSLCALFESFISVNAYKAEALYILGDLFDVWLGDDLISDFESHIASLLRELKQSGVKTYLVPGNRDFLFGQKFAQLADITLLPDPTPIQLYQKSCLLCHGDELCTEDGLYQYFRKFVQSPISKYIFLKLPKKYRQNIANKLRANSKNYQKNQPLSKLDVTEAGVQQSIKRHPAEIIIHGHVHRAKHALHTVSNKTVNRYVLGTWHKTGSVISVTSNPFEVEHHIFSEGVSLIS
tara:strand:+ start:62129 stop:62887 length:759 start_codon:yes stop_codon:yes gene_type:complete